ncbi:hypothetical protein ACWCQL_16750 [Streptomyces sp. NPDC002073]|uniref:hypothetical protein n=1 Tax=Streptomyces sp. NBC_00239 TaxID=2903640 RepID=UPI002E2A431F|nr:hypothetical protein [Streptomyces sp. NBC_00239]
MTGHDHAHPAADILLTGAAGRIGRMLRPGLAARGWTVRPYDLQPAPRTGRTRPRNGSYARTR